MHGYELDKQRLLNIAEQLIRYFENFSTEGHRFRLGLYMAKQWHRYLLEEQLDLAEVKLFSEVLEGRGSEYGSGFLELELQVKWWTAALVESGVENQQWSVSCSQKGR